MAVDLEEMDHPTAVLILMLPLQGLAELDTQCGMTDNHKPARDMDRADMDHADEAQHDARYGEPRLDHTYIRVECVCTNSLPLGDVYTAPCGHYYCEPCLARVFQQALTDVRFYPPRCCQQVMPFEVVRDLLPLELARRFAGRQPELDDPQPVYCYVPTCSQYIGARDREGNLGFCPGCNTAVCLMCKGAYHAGHCPDHEDTTVEEVADRYGWRRCPGCGCMVELRSGCHHITCFCKTEFCYVCGSTPWKVPDPHHPGEFKRTCQCQQFNAEDMPERGQYIADEEEMEQAPDEIGCYYHDWRHRGGRHVCEGCGEEFGRFIMHCRRCHLQRCQWCARNNVVW